MLPLLKGHRHDLRQNFVLYFIYVYNDLLVESK